jgi:hypothetical protein
MDAKAIEKTFTEQLKKYSEEFQVPYRDVQVLIYKNKETGAIEFNLYANRQFIRKLDIQKDILNLKIDFLGKAFMAAKYLELILGAFASELRCEEHQVSVQLVARSNEDATVCIALQKDLEFVRWVDVSEFEF